MSQPPRNCPVPSTMAARIRVYTSPRCSLGATNPVGALATRTNNVLTINTKRSTGRTERGCKTTTGNVRATWNPSWWVVPILLGLDLSKCCYGDAATSALCVDPVVQRGGCRPSCSLSSANDPSSVAPPPHFSFAANTRVGKASSVLKGCCHPTGGRDPTTQAAPTTRAQWKWCHAKCYCRDSRFNRISSVARPSSLRMVPSKK